MNELSLKNLLSSPSRDYVLRNNGDKVLIADLESKVVGLYFYDSKPSCAEYVLSIYEKLKAEGMDFEIVFINRYSKGGYPDEESFNKNFEKMPWLALPFGDMKCEKLAYTIGIDTYKSSCGVAALIFIKSREFCQLYGLEVVREYGIEAYPFAIENAAAIELERRSLFSLFNAEGQEFVIQNDNDKTKIKMSKLKGKSVCMLRASNVPCKILSCLINWYNTVKRMDDDFKMIYVSKCKSATRFNDIFKQMPSTWLALPFGAGDTIADMLQLWDTGKDDVMVAANFKTDGKYLMKTHVDDSNVWKLHSDDIYPYDFDFNTLEEVCAEIVTENRWFS